MLTFEMPAGNFKRIISAIHSLGIEEGTFQCDGNAIRLIEMDPSHVSMGSALIPKYAFESINLDGNEPEFEFSVDFDEMKKIMNRSVADEKMSVTVTDKVTIKFISDARTRTFTMPLTTPLTDTKYKIPEIEWLISMKLDASNWDQFIKDSYMVGDTITFEVDQTDLTVSAESDWGTYSYFYPLADFQEIEHYEHVHSVFNLNYLNDLKEISGEIELRLGNDVPLALHFKVNDTEIILILAPRHER